LETFILATLGNCINISNLLTSKQAMFFAKVIGCANVIRNQKVLDFREDLLNNRKSLQGYSHIKKRENLEFLKEVPVQILRNSASSVFNDLISCQKGLRKFPKIKNKSSKRNAIFTKELFNLIENNDKTILTIFNSKNKDRKATFSIKLPHKKENIGAQFRISRQGTRFYLSYSINNQIENIDNQKLLKELSHLSEEELFQKSIGIDRGVNIAAYCSNGQKFQYNIEEKKRLKEKLNKKSHYQRILAKKKRLNKNKTKKCESNRQRKLQEKISNIDKNIGHIRTNACHHWSKSIVEITPLLVIFENLKIKNMTKRAKPKKDENGRKYIRNNANAKSGLNRAILNANMGKLGDFTKYKLNLQGKAYYDTYPAYTSKTHYLCKGRNTLRPTQDTLICLDCNKKEHADYNASKMIQSNGINDIKEEKFNTKKPRKKISRRKTKDKSNNMALSVEQEPALRQKSPCLDVRE
jgi:putative transposase